MNDLDDFSEQDFGRALRVHLEASHDLFIELGFRHLLAYCYNHENDAAMKGVVHSFQFRN